MPQSLQRPASPVVDDWEIDISQLQIDAKIASGAFSNLYRGSYCGQEVAVKILKDVHDDTSQYQEFLQVGWGLGLRNVQHTYGLYLHILRAERKGAEGEVSKS